MSVEYLDLADFIAISAAVTGLDEDTIVIHPLPDGNKRAAWVSMRMFIDMNGWSWSRRPDLDEGEETVLAIAAGELDEERTAAWLRAYLVAPEVE